MIQCSHKVITNRLSRIEGQVRGVLRMVEEYRYCIDVLAQIRAVRAALHQVEQQILRDHIGHCVMDSFRSNDEQDRQQKIDELLNVIGKLTQ